MSEIFISHAIPDADLAKKLMDFLQWQYDLKRDCKRQAMDAIREKYGYSAVYRVVSRTKAGTAIARTRLIGRHQK